MTGESFKALRNCHAFKYLLCWTAGGKRLSIKGNRTSEQNYRIFHLAQYSSVIYCTAGKIKSGMPLLQVTWLWRPGRCRKASRYHRGTAAVFWHLWSMLDGKETALCATWYFLEWQWIIICAQLLELMYSTFLYSHWTWALWSQYHHILVYMWFHSLNDTMPNLSCSSWMHSLYRLFSLGSPSTFCCSTQVFHAPDHSWWRNLNLFPLL